MPCWSVFPMSLMVFAASIPSATFIAPFGPIVPVVAIAMSLGVAAGATHEQLVGGLAALAVGGVMYVIRGRGAVSTVRSVRL